MKSFRVHAIFMGIALGLTAGRWSIGQTTAPSTDDPQVAELVKQLGDDDPIQRDRAAAYLEGLPDADLPLLRRASKDDSLSLEQKLRIEKALPRMERRAELRASRREQNVIGSKYASKIATEFYASNGHQNPAWDGPASQLITLDAQRPAQASADDQSAWCDKERKSADAALAAGCDDPDFLARAGLLMNDMGAPPMEVFNVFRKGLDAVVAGKGSPLSRSIILGRVLRGRADGYDGGIDYKNWGPVDDLLHRMIASYKDQLARTDTPPEIALNIAGNILQTWDAVNAKHDCLVDEVCTPLEKAVPNDARTLCLKADLYIKWAWEARGNGWANTVTPDGWQKYADRLNTASDALASAWQLDPKNPDAPTKMLTVALGQDWTVAKVETWWKRAMYADPDNMQACNSMLYYLQPKWHGSPEAMIAFGQQCLDTGNFSGNIPFVLVDAHEEIAALAPDPRQYYVTEPVWTDISSVYTRYLRLYPDADDVRSKYALRACRCERWSEANRQFLKLGDKADATVFGSQMQLDAMKKQAADEAAKKPN